MSENVVEIGCITCLDLPPERILTKALQADLVEVIICGTDKEGNEYFASSMASGPENVYHLQRANWKLMQMHDELESGETA